MGPKYVLIRFIILNREDWEKSRCLQANISASSSCSEADNVQFQYYSAKFTSGDFKNAFLQSSNFIVGLNLISAISVIIKIKNVLLQF